MSIRRRALVKAIKRIREFYKAGKKSLGARSGPAVHGTNAIKDEAKRIGMNEDTLRKARQFADPENGYSPKEVQSLFKMILAVQAGQEENNAIFGKTHIIRLVSVHDKKRRMKIQKEAITESWSTAYLEAELKKRFGTRRAGGRRRQIPHDEKDFLTQLEGMCEEWRRWRAELDRDAEHYPFHKLTPVLQDQIVKASDRLESLRQAVETALGKLEPRREIRQILGDENKTASQAK